MTFILTAYLAFNALNGFGFAPRDSVIIKADWKELKGKRYIIHYPYTWKANQNIETEGFTLYVPGPKSFGAFQKTINLSVQDISGKDLDLDGYVYLSKRQIHTLVENSELLKSERIDSVDIPYHEIIYSGDYDDEQLKWKMRFWVVHELVYILTYTSSKNTFGLNSGIAEEVMDTFHLNYSSLKIKNKKTSKKKRPRSER